MKKEDEVLIFARHTKKWEFAHFESNDPSNLWWVRRDGSTICEVGKEVATMLVPPPPKNWNRRNGR